MAWFEQQIFQKKLSERLPKHTGRWQSSLVEQIKDLPAFERAEREVQRHLEIFTKKRFVLTT